MEFSSKKYMILMALICIVFVIFIVKAFDYLPDKSVEGKNPNINMPMQPVQNTYNNPVNQPQQNETYDNERHKSGYIDFMPKEYRNQNNEPSGDERNIRRKKRRSYNDFEEINAPRSVIEEELPPRINPQTSALSPDELALKSIMKAQKMKTDYDYNGAINELQKVAEITGDKELLAISYEKIAELYALQKRFETALSFANKANSISPSANRQMLIARIYYQYGDTENAVSKMNSILSSGFRDN